MWLLPKECLCLPASEQQRGKLPTLALAGLLGQERVEAKRQVAQLVPLLWSYQTPSGALILGVWRSGSSPSLLQVIRQLFIRFSDARIMYETESPSTQVLSFGLGDSLLAIGAAFVMESFFLYTTVRLRQADNAGYLGLILMLVGGAIAVGSIFARRADHPTGVGRESRVH